jgi:hypothetical protein
MSISIGGCTLQGLTNESISSIAIIVDGQAATDREGLIVGIAVSGPYNSTPYRHRVPKSPHEKLLVVVCFLFYFIFLNIYSITDQGCVAHRS